MVGLVLQGGGAKGAFQAGAIQALREEGITFDGAVGTSIGSINAALVAQNDYDLLLELWNNIDIDMVFDENSRRLPDLIADTSKRNAVNIYRTFKDIIKDRGMDMQKGITLMSKYVNEYKIRSSKLDFGLTTLTKEDKEFVPLQLFKEDIPKGQLLNYIIASANFPLFKREYIEDKEFMDGGLYDNLPISMLTDRYYDKIIAIRLGPSIAPVKAVDAPHCEITYIDPSEKPGTVLNFSRASCQKALLMGYFDTKKMLKHFDGNKYYIDPRHNHDASKLLIGLSEKDTRALCSLLDLPYTPMTIPFTYMILERLKVQFNMPFSYSPINIILTVIETIAKNINIERLKLYRLRDFVLITFEKYMVLPEDIKVWRISPEKKRIEIADIILRHIAKII